MNMAMGMHTGRGTMVIDFVVTIGGERERGSLPTSCREESSFFPR